MQISLIGRLISLLTVVAIAVGVATSAVPRGSTVEPAAAELPFARSRDGVRETYIVSFGLFGPESVFASEAQKAAPISGSAPGGGSGPSSLQRQARWQCHLRDALSGSPQRGSSYGPGRTRRSPYTRHHRGGARPALIRL